MDGTSFATAAAVRGGANRPELCADVDLIIGAAALSAAPLQSDHCIVRIFFLEMNSINCVSGNGFET